MTPTPLFPLIFRGEVQYEKSQEHEQYGMNEAYGVKDLERPIQASQSSRGSAERPRRGHLAEDNQRCQENAIEAQKQEYRM